jgi:hypothetical protein
MSRYWYAYNTTGDPFSIRSYRRITSTPGCLNGPVICSLYAPGGLINPTPFSSNMIQYIANGLANNIAEPAVPANSKFYVYLKSLTL